MKTNVLLLSWVIVSCILISGCQKDPETIAPASPAIQELKAGAGVVKIAVLSDIHIMAPSLLADPGAYSGIPFQTYLASDPKLLGESSGIFAQAIEQINKDKPNILLITGDLTKDGEAVSHREMLSLLESKLDKKIKVFVIPGNHDINNPNAKKFYSDHTSPVARIFAGDFPALYGDYGYEDAISRDPNSLSYVVEPLKNFRIIAIDACQYTGTHLDAGIIKDETMAWIGEQMAQATGQHMQVVAMMHHMLLPHYQGQEFIDPGFVVNNWQLRSSQLMSMGLKVIFTGHYHANDIVAKHDNGKTLYDIQTGSTVSSPLPYRIIKYYNNDRLEIETKYITGIYFDSKPVQEYARDFLAPRLTNIFYYMMTNPPYNLSPVLGAEGAPFYMDGFMAHYAGDETLAPEEQAALMAWWNKIPDANPYKSFMLQVPMTWWTDLNPSDNFMVFDLTTGR